MISMARVSKPLDEEEDTQIKIELHDHVDIPVRYSSLERVYSVSSSSSSLCCVSAAGSHNVMSQKVDNAQELPINDAFEGHGCSDDFELRSNRRPEIVHVYCRRKRRRRRESFLESAMARNEGVGRKDGIVKIDENDFSEEEEEQKQKQKKRRIGNGELMKLGVDSSSLSVSTTPRLRGCRINAVCSGNKHNGSSRRKGKVVQASATAKKWVRLGFTYRLLIPV